MCDHIFYLVNIITNITLAVPEKIHKLMKKHSEIRWSEVARQAIERLAMKLELLEQAEYEEQVRFWNNELKNSELTESDVNELDAEVKKI